VSTNQICGRQWVRRWLRRIIAVGALGAAVTALALGIGAWRSRGLVDAGARLVSDEDYLPATRALTRAVVAAPRDARAHYYLGLAYAGVGLCGAASIHLWEAARLAPQYRRLFAGPGQACRNAASLGITGPIRSRGQD
jgi:hypothetical protein